MTQTSTTVLIDRLRTAIGNTDDVLEAAGHKSEGYSFLAYGSFDAEQAIDEWDEVMSVVNTSTAGHTYDSFRMSALASAEARLKLWNDVVALGSRSQDDIDLLITKDAIIEVAKQRATRLLKGWDGAHSSDPFSNAISHIENEVNARYVERFGGSLTIKDAS